MDPAEKVKLNSITHSVRVSQAVLQYGVGAMVDFPDQTLMTAAPEYWQERIVKIHDERLEKALHVDYFGMPKGEDEDFSGEGISYVRFPEWYFCPKCRRFKPIKQWIADYQNQRGSARARETDPYMIKHMKCPSCKQDLVVTRIVSVCNNGHIDDFPWVKWVHCQNFGGAVNICSRPSLTFKTGASSAEGLEGLRVTCECCHAQASLKGAFDKKKFAELDEKYGDRYGFKCTGRHPWKNKTECCNLFPHVLQRGSSSVYFPITASSLVIPPYSSIITAKIENSKAFSEGKDFLSNLMLSQGMDQKTKAIVISSQIERYIERISIEIGIEKELVKPIIERKWVQTSDEEYNTESIKYRAEEYDALSGILSMDNERYGSFQREQTNIVEYGLPFVKKISLIHKVREVQALTGFSRINPPDKSESIRRQGNYVSVKEPETRWYPAYEVRGEGIFIEFDSDAIDQWVQDNEGLKHRIDTLSENYVNSYYGSTNPRRITGKFVLLHTLSHLLIKQLSFECGYSIASLKERIYCSDASEGKEMAGILIYTASGDSEGTMGGLVRQGRADTFPHIFNKALEAGITCSNDPVCSLSLGQGRDSLNLAACYSCALIPETSCEEFNSFLDRGTVVGTYNNKYLGFYCNQLYGIKQWDMAPQKTTIFKSSKKTEETILVPKTGTGTDYSDPNFKYSDIWKSIEDWAGDYTEKQLLKSLISSSDLFALKERPVKGCSFMLSGDPEEYEGTLIWKNSKVVYFSAEYHEDYEKALKSDWQCFCGNDNSLTVARILESLKEK